MPTLQDVCCKWSKFIKIISIPAMPTKIPTTTMNELETALEKFMLFMPYSNMIKPRRQRIAPATTTLISKVITECMSNFSGKKC
jgi:hypothetical protein